MSVNKLMLTALQEYKSSHKQEMTDMDKNVIYKGLKCILYETYMNDDRPLFFILYF